MAPTAADVEAAAVLSAHRLRSAGRFEEARAAYSDILARQPAHAEALNGLGIALIGLRRFEDAAGAFRAAIATAPNYPEAFNNLGNTLLEMRRHDEAIAAFQTAVRLRPDYHKAQLNLAEALRQQRRWPESEAAARRAIELRPASAEAHYTLGLVVHKQDRAAEAADILRTALGLKERYAEAHAELGSVMHTLGRYDEAEAEYRKAIAIREDFAEAYANLGNCLTERGRCEEAYTVLMRALAIRQDIPETYFNLGVALSGLHRYAEAQRNFETVLGFNPQLPDAHYCRGLMLLTQGQYAEGWRECEWRRKFFGEKTFDMKTYAEPDWRGEPLAGRRILIHGEQGLGDKIQFVRFVPLVAAKGGTVILRVPATLQRLCQSVRGVSQVVRAEAPEPPFDVHLPLMSLPAVLGTTLDTIPASVPYLHPEPDDVARWRERLADRRGLRVGVVWSGEPRPHDPNKREFDLRRSLALAQMRPLLELPDVAFVSLQKGAARAQLAGLDPALRPLDVMDEIGDFADTAALAANLDLVITVDTSVAHLAGAIGKPVWILVRFDPDWRWLLDRDDSPWYPTARLFRQRAPGDWDEVIGRVAAELPRFAAERERRRPPPGV